MEMLVLLLFLQAFPSLRSQNIEDNNDLWALVGVGGMLPTISKHLTQMVLNKVNTIDLK